MRQEIAALKAQPQLTADEKTRLASLQQTADKAQKDPDFLEDPKGYIDRQAQETKNALKKLQEENAQSQQREAAQTELNQLLGTVSAHEQTFIATTPDYHDAVTHMRTVRASQLQMLYPQATPEQITRQITSEEINAARQILSQGGDPVQFAYNFAKTLGYTPKSQAAAATTTQAAPKVDKDAARSLGGGGGGDLVEEDNEDGMSPLRDALRERFGVKKSRRQ